MAYLHFVNHPSTLRLTIQQKKMLKLVDRAKNFRFNVKPNYTDFEVKHNVMGLTIPNSNSSLRLKVIKIFKMLNKPMLQVLSGSRLIHHWGCNE